MTLLAENREMCKTGERISENESIREFLSEVAVRLISDPESRTWSLCCTARHVTMLLEKFFTSVSSPPDDKVNDFGADRPKGTGPDD